jgi:hypothetical protein
LNPATERVPSKKWVEVGAEIIPRRCGHWEW